MTEKSSEDGLRDGELHAIKERLQVMDIHIKTAISALTHDVDALKKAVWLLYGAIAIVGFVIPLVQKWVAG